MLTIEDYLEIIDALKLKKESRVAKKVQEKVELLVEYEKLQSEMKERQDVLNNKARELFTPADNKKDSIHSAELPDGSVETLTKE